MVYSQFMSADTLYQELKSLDKKEKQRFFKLFSQRDFAEMDPEGFVRYWNDVSKSTTKWHTREELIAIMESSEDD